MFDGGGGMGGGGQMMSMYGTPSNIYGGSGMSGGGYGGNPNMNRGGFGRPGPGPSWLGGGMGPGGNTFGNTNQLSGNQIENLQSVICRATARVLVLENQLTQLRLKKLLHQYPFA